MGGSQSRSVASHHNNASHSRRQEASIYEHAASQTSSRKTSASSSPSSSKPHRHHAVRHREAPAAAPNSRREFLLKQQQLAQEGYFIAGAAGHDAAALAHEDYLAYAVADVPGYFYNDGSAACRDLPLQRSHAVRTATAPTPRDGSRRKAMIHGAADHYYRPMEVPVAPTQPQPQPQPQYAPQYQPHSSSSTPRYMVHPRPAGHARVSRFREEF